MKRQLISLLFDLFLLLLFFFGGGRGEWYTVHSSQHKTIMYTESQKKPHFLRATLAKIQINI